MKEFDLPIIKDLKLSSRILSMDEYLDFVDFNLKNAFDAQAYAKWKKLLIVKERFQLIEH